MPSKVAYDIALDIIDSPDGDCHVTFIVRDDIYDQAAANQFAQSYVSLAESFAGNPTMILSETTMFDGAIVEETLDLGRGKYNLYDTTYHY